MRDEAAVSTVMAFLKAHSVPVVHTSINDELITTVVTAATAQALLHTEFTMWKSLIHPNVAVHRADKYYLPSNVAAVVDFVADVIRLPPSKPLIVKPNRPGPVPVHGPANAKPLVHPGCSLSFPSCSADGYATPCIIAQQYNMTSNKVSNVKSTNSVFEIGASYMPTDLEVGCGWFRCVQLDSVSEYLILNCDDRRTKNGSMLACLQPCPSWAGTTFQSVRALPPLATVAKQHWTSKC